MEEYYDNPFEGLELNEITELEYRDTSRKDIGDRVNVIDYSSVSHVRGAALDAMDLEYLDNNTVFLVIETNRKVVFNANFHDYKQDLVIVDMQTKKQYRVISGHVKLI
jgi:hypothetical protein